MQRALLNLFSNALKYSPAGTPLRLRAEATEHRLLLQLENVCDESDAELLKAAFHRLEQRSQLPDPRWGVGLGLPLAQAIARLHGGMVALEARNHTAVVTLSLSRRTRQPAALRSPTAFYTGGTPQTLLELADVLPNRLYHPDAL